MKSKKQKAHRVRWAKCLNYLVVEYSTLSHHHPTENNVTSAGARNNEDSLAPFHKFALPRSLPHHISAGDSAPVYQPNQETRKLLVQTV